MKGDLLLKAGMQTSLEKVEWQLTAWQKSLLVSLGQSWVHSHCSSSQATSGGWVHGCAEEGGVSVLKGGLEHVMLVLRGPLEGDHQVGPEL